jgi:hypothetical protein
MTFEKLLTGKFKETSTVEPMDDEFRKLLKKDNREHLYALWGRAKESNFGGLSVEEDRMARIMLDHQDELYNQFEFADLTYDHESDADTQYDPFLHIAIHASVQAQLDLRDPVETSEFYNAMRNKNHSHHDGVHFIGQIFLCMMFDVIESNKPFDLETYRGLLTKYKDCDPMKLMDLLENDPLLSD